MKIKRTPPVVEGMELEVKAVDLVAGGDALARAGTFPLFIAGLYPGDEAMVRVTEVKSGFGRAEVLRLTIASSLRKLQPCSAAAECGGCDWTSLRLDQQLLAKQRILVDSLRRVGKFAPDLIPSIRLHPSPLNYRLRTRLHLDVISGKVGFYAMRSHDVVELPADCEVVGPVTLARRDEIAASARSAGRSMQVVEIGEALHTAAEGSEGENLRITAGGFDYSLSVSSFFQVNRHLLGSMIEAVHFAGASVGNRGTALDLYGGVGFFALPLAKLFERVITVENNPVAHRFARLNAQPYPNLDAVHANVEAFCRAPGNPDFIMLDPPRAGTDPAVLEAISRTRAEKICYLSCDPVTFARDASRLARRGWKLVSLALFDLFPNTHHIETFSSFERET